MRTVKIKEDSGIMGKCPVCGKVFQADGTAKFCKHVLAWYDYSEGDIVYAKARTRKALDKLCDGDIDYEVAMKQMFGKDKGVILVKFDEGYLGGCSYGGSLAAFKKEAAV
jgi:uncharacterized C2H2 Zn-finger protein